MTTHTINRNWVGSVSGQSITGSVQSTGDTEVNGDITLSNSSSQPAVLAIRAAGLQSLYFKSDIAVTVTFRDAGGTSVGSVALAAATPYDWTSADGVTIPISADVAMLNLSSTGSGTLQYRILQDGTPAAATAALSGTLQTTHLESGIAGGGYTAILTLTGAKWADTGAAFNAQRQAILDGFVSAQSEAAGWNAQEPTIPVTAVARTSDTVCTITLPVLGSYSITVNETITATIPAAATTAAEPIVASPTVTVTANS